MSEFGAAGGGGITWKKIAPGDIAALLSYFKDDDPGHNIAHVVIHPADLPASFNYLTGWNDFTNYVAFDTVWSFGGAVFTATGPNVNDPPTAGSGIWGEIAENVDQMSKLEYGAAGGLMFVHFDLCLNFENITGVGHAGGLYITLPEGKQIGGRSFGQGKMNVFPSFAPLDINVQARESFADKILLTAMDYNAYQGSLLTSDAYPGQFQPHRLVGDIAVPIL